MNNYNFPKSWHLSVQTIQELGILLKTDPNTLKSTAKSSGKRYRQIPIKGRILSVPNNSLKIIQSTILKELLDFEFPPYVHGGIKRRSIITNATSHQCKEWVVCFDIRKFFPSVHLSKIKRALLELKCSEEVIRTLSHLTTYNFQLPQGAPTSPALANLVLFRLDSRISKLCKIHKYSYSRFFDDLTISGNKDPKVLLRKIKDIIKQEGYLLNKNPKKLRIQNSSAEQVVTGIIVNEKTLRIPKATLNQIKVLLTKLAQGLLPIEGVENPLKLQESIKGKIDFLSMVDPALKKPLLTLWNGVDWGLYGSSLN